MTVKEKEETVEEIVETKTKKTCVNKTELDKVTKNLTAYKKEVLSDLKVFSSKFDENQKNMQMLFASLNDIVKRVDALEKKDVSPNEETNSKFELIDNKFESIEYDVGELIDKVDVIFDGTGDENEDLISRIEKLERVSGRLHKRNA